MIFFFKCLQMENEIDALKKKYDLFEKNIKKNKNKCSTCSSTYFNSVNDNKSLTSMPAQSFLKVFIFLKIIKKKFFLIA